jgi:hypothetical protein
MFRDDREPGKGSGPEWSPTWKAEAAAAREKQLERLRRWGIGVVAAFVLLPPRLVILLGLAVGAVYMCLNAVRSVSVGKQDKSL